MNNLLLITGAGASYDVVDRSLIPTKESMQILVEIGNSLRIYLSSIFRGSNMYTHREIVACSVS